MKIYKEYIMQRQIIKYQAIDEDSGKEIIGFEFRRGMMKEDRMKKDESTLIPVVEKLIKDAS